MARYGDRIAAGRAPELLWLLEHPPLYTGGTRSRTEDFLEREAFPYYPTDRGGELTYHGPGQRIVYTLLDVRRRTGGDARAFVRLLESCVIDALDRLGVAGRSDPARPGVWVDKPGAADGEAKIAALGLKVRRGVSRHGLSINVSPEMEHFRGIVPCGLHGTSVTSLAELGASTDMNAVDNALRDAFAAHLGPIRTATET